MIRETEFLGLRRLDAFAQVGDEIQQFFAIFDDESGRDAAMRRLEAKISGLKLVKPPDNPIIARYVRTHLE